MGRILVVDDEEMDRVLMGYILREAGHETLLASDGESALRIWRSESIDLVVTDIVMPEMDGLNLLEAIRMEDPGLPIIAVSGISAKRLNKAARAGARAILTKPVDPSELLAEVEEALDPGRHREAPEF